ncbi:hypothetical protein VKT23_012156 [Stygiomarasmius scandens]|uniref:Uncharacterized protein n=1 Tax=Marasmiellus scandens TaxID=2682957 RepID=A0ABR1J7K0_9AGAR
MRFRGGGVGHVSTLEHTSLFETDAGVDEQSLPVYDKNGNIIEDSITEGQEEEEELEEEDEDEDENEDKDEDEEDESSDRSDYSSESESSEEDYDSDLGPEDGEVDDIDELGLESLGYGNY